MLQIHLLVLSMIGQLLAAPGPMDRPLLQRDPNNPLLIFASGKVDDEAKYARSIPAGADLTGMGFGLNAFTGNPMNPMLRAPINPLVNNFGGLGISPMLNRFGSYNAFNPYSNFGVNTLPGINNYNGMTGLANVNAFGLNGLNGLGGFGGLNGGYNGMGFNGLTGVSGLSNGIAGFSSLNQLNNPYQYSYLNGANGFNGVNNFNNGYNNGFNTGFNTLNGFNNGFSSVSSQYQPGQSSLASFSNQFGSGRDVNKNSAADSDSLKRIQDDPTSPYYVRLFDGFSGNSNGFSGNRDEQQESASFGGQSKRNAAGRQVVTMAAGSQVRTNQPTL